MSLTLKASNGGQSEEDRDEGSEAGGDTLASGGSRVEFSASGGADGSELSAGEAVMEALTNSSGKMIGAWQRGFPLPFSKD